MTPKRVVSWFGHRYRVQAVWNWPSSDLKKRLVCLLERRGAHIGTWGDVLLVSGDKLLFLLPVE